MFQKYKAWRAVKLILKAGEKEILSGKIFLEYYQWQKKIAPPDASKEDLGKLDLKIKQLEEVNKNNEARNLSFKQFLKSL